MWRRSHTGRTPEGVSWATSAVKTGRQICVLSWKKVKQLSQLSFRPITMRFVTVANSVEPEWRGVALLK